MASTGDSAPRFAAMRYRDFRLIWFGELVSITGSQMQVIAINWHVFQLLRGTTQTISLFGSDYVLSGEALGLGLLGLVRIIPIILFALIGGILADVGDRRRLMIWTRTAACGIAMILAALTFGGNASVEVIYILTAFTAATTAFDSPARQAIVPNLVAREHLTNAVSLNNIMRQVASIVGPALAGVLVASTDVSIVYFINGLTYLAAIFALARISYRGAASAPNTGMGLDALKEGLSFTFNTRLIWATMLLDFFATFFSSALLMLPIVADNLVAAGAATSGVLAFLQSTGSMGAAAAVYGLLATAQPVGSLLTGAILALRRDIEKQGVTLLVSVAIYGLATAIFGLTTSVLIAYVMLALTGAADTVSTVIRNTIRQLMTPDRLRGRMTSVNMIFFMGGPQLGELEAGLLAALAGAPFAIVSGGLLTVILTGWVAWKYPRLRNYTNETETPPEPAFTQAA